MKQSVKISRDKLSLLSARGRYIRSTSYIPLKWENMRSIADITKLNEIALRSQEVLYITYLI